MGENNSDRGADDNNRRSKNGAVEVFSTNEGWKKGSHFTLASFGENIFMTCNCSNLNFDLQTSEGRTGEDRTAEAGGKTPVAPLNFHPRDLENLLADEQRLNCCLSLQFELQMMQVKWT